MADIRLKPLSGRTPVKLVVNVMPDIHAQLADHAAFYAESYGREESVTALIPAMLTAFLESDRAFMRSRVKKHE